MISGDISLRVTLSRRGTNIQKHIEWMEYLTSPSFLKDWKERFEGPRNLERLKQSAKVVFKERVYDTYDPVSYKRTYDALESFKAGSNSSGAMPATAVYSDPFVATAIAGQVRGGFSYAAFFEKPDEFFSFIKASPEGDQIVRHRPFFDLMTQEHKRAAEEVNANSFLTQVAKRMPKQKTTT